MNTNDINKIPIPQFLSSISIEPERKYNGYWMYKSIINPEQRTGSLKVSKNNLWVDYSEGNLGGTLIDLVLLIYPELTVRDIVWKFNHDFFSFHQPIFEETTIEKEKNYEIKAIKPLTNIQLINYIQSRCISLKMAEKYCVELHYNLNDKTYYGIGFKNDSEGYEIRNKYIKMCLGTKAPSYFNNKSSQIVLLESWSDFLSFLTLYPKAEKYYDFLILNSVGTLNNVLIKESNKYLYKCTNEEHYKSINIQLDKSINVYFDKSIKVQKDNCIKNTLYKQLKYEMIICCFDNDDAGNKATQKVQKTFPNLVKDGRYLYPNHKDLNDRLSTK